MELFKLVLSYGLRVIELGNGNVKGVILTDGTWYVGSRIKIS